MNPTTSMCHFYFRSILLLVMVCSCCALSVFAQDEDKPSVELTEFESFAIILERNIFDSTRRKKRTEPLVIKPKPKIDEVSLLGTLITDSGSYAFFEGSGTDFKSVSRSGDTIAGHTISEIQTTQIMLESNKQTKQLSVGMALQREDEGEWIITSASNRGRQSYPSKSTSSSQLASKPSSDSNETETTDDSQNDILKKLMEKRRQELQK